MPCRIFWPSKGIILIFLIIFSLSISLNARETDRPPQIYQMPPEEIASAIDVPAVPSVIFSPNNRWMIILGQSNFISIEEISRPELRLAGLRINPKNNGPSRYRYYNSITVRELPDGQEINITGLPPEPKIGNLDWSPDGNLMAFTVAGEETITLYALQPESGDLLSFPDISLNDAYEKPFHWLPDNRTLICKTIPKDRSEPPAAPSAPAGPVIRENLGDIAAAVTYADLLNNEYDEKLLDYYLETRLLKVQLDGIITPIGSDDKILRAEPSPDGKYILVEILRPPYSYLVKIDRFPRRIEIWDIDGNIIRRIADQPLAEDIPPVSGAVRTGPREFNWRNDAPAELYYAVAQDKGDPRIEAKARDQIYIIKSPFQGDPLPLFALEYRYEEILWCNDDLALISEWWWPTRRIRRWAFAPGAAHVDPEMLFDYSWQDRYNHPGNPLLSPGEFERDVLLLVDKGLAILLEGYGGSPEGDRPFLDKFSLVDRTSVRLWRSTAPYYERIVRILDRNAQEVIISRESVTTPPNYFLKDIAKNDEIQLTAFPNPAPQLANIQKELIKYKRDDSLDLSGILYLPEGYTADYGPLPMVMWAYPVEFKDMSAAGQVKGSPYRFVHPKWYSPILWLLRGYAVLDYPAMPIVGEGDEEPNDTFIEQLVANARAAVDEVIRRGVADPDRIAIGGSSYGAFMAANLLAHSDLFRAGIARTGAYNRTLTPFGFQNEERTFWEAPEVYFRMSPFMHADKINEPVLLIHGDADNNAGTFPMQSERFYNALTAHGATVRLVMLPYESHSYRARENIMHVLWEMDRWLEKYVKNASSPKKFDDKISGE